MEIHERMLKSECRSTIHFIETLSSLLHNAPYISTVTKDYETLKQTQIDLSIKDDVKLVYGLQGIAVFLLIINYNNYLIL